MVTSSRKRWTSWPRRRPTGAARASPSGRSSAGRTAGNQAGRTCPRRESASAALGFQSHRLPEFAPDFLRLAVVPPEVLEQLAPERVLPILLERHALGVELPADVGQLDALVELGIANETLGVLAVRDRGEVPEELLA